MPGHQAGVPARLEVTWQRTEQQPVMRAHRWQSDQRNGARSTGRCGFKSRRHDVQSTQGGALRPRGGDVQVAVRTGEKPQVAVPAQEAMAGAEDNRRASGEHRGWRGERVREVGHRPPARSNNAPMGCMDGRRRRQRNHRFKWQAARKCQSRETLVRLQQGAWQGGSLGGAQ